MAVKEPEYVEASSCEIDHCRLLQESGVDKGADELELQSPTSSEANAEGGVWIQVACAAQLAADEQNRHEAD